MGTTHFAPTQGIELVSPTWPALSCSLFPVRRSFRILRSIAIIIIMMIFFAASSGYS
jgi:hypothetical protein